MIKFKQPSRTVIIAAVIVLVLVGVSIWKLNSVSHDTTQSTTTPLFQTVLPANTSITKLGGWEKLTPPNNEPYYVYADSIDSVAIKVSEQPLSQDFKDALDSKLADVARGYSATDSFVVDGTKVYIGTNSKGPQSVITSKKGLLLLITSENRISNESWQNYIKSLS